MLNVVLIPLSLILLYLGGEGTLKGVLAFAKKFNITSKWYGANLPPGT